MMQTRNSDAGSCSTKNGGLPDAPLKIKPRNRLIPKDTPLEGKILLTIMYFFLVASTFTILFGEMLFMPKDYCSKDYVKIDYENPDYHQNPCRLERTYFLLYLTPKECDYARRILTSVLFGGIIGYERKSADRPAGIRTMSLVSLGSCFFTISSMRAFESSTMGWDAARVSAAIPSGVGFLGAGLIWKGSQGAGADEAPAVHGLTTAASVWLSASIGVNVGGKLYVVAAYTCALVVLVLRVGPRLYFQDDTSSYFDDYDDDDDDEDDDEDDDDEEDDEDNESEWNCDDEVSDMEEEQFHQQAVAASYGAVASKNSKGEIEMLVPLNDVGLRDEHVDVGINKKSKKEKAPKRQGTFHG